MEVVRLKRRHLVTDVYWPRFTLLGQAFGSMLLMFEAMRKKVPFAMLDTGGYAFGYPVAKVAGCFPIAYVHYPFVSTDMLQRVRDRVVEYNNAAEVASSPLRTRAKLFYYRTLAMLYGFAGRYSSVRRLPLFLSLPVGALARPGPEGNLRTGRRGSRDTSASQPHPGSALVPFAQRDMDAAV